MQPFETEGTASKHPVRRNEELQSLLTDVQERRRQWNQAQTQPQRSVASTLNSAFSPVFYLFLTALGLAVVFGIMSLLSMRVAPGGASPLVAGTQQEGSLCSWDTLYLPEAVLPLRYDLNISARLNSPGSQSPAVAHGHVAIRVRAAHPTKCVVINAGENMNISSVRLMLSGRQDGIAGRVRRFNPGLQQAIIELDELLPATDPGPAMGQVELRPVENICKEGDPEEDMLPQLLLDFNYDVQQGLDGFYGSMYTDENGAEHPILSTQFEAVAARKAFPCWDEPRFKARFATVLAAPPAPYIVLSNMPVREGGTRQRGDGLTEYTFQVSPPMSSYLVAWVMGELGSVARECGTEFGTVPLHVWSTPDKVSKLATAADVGCTALRTLSSTFGVPFVLPKLDLVGIPNFAAGAMENWGLITYRETALLVDTTVKPNDIQQDFSVATVVSHEIVHQWFGNLVTCADWSELWLNEGFAMYFENLAASAYRPSYGYFSKFFTEDTVYAFAEDTLGSHPMSGTPAQGMAYSRLKSLAQADAQFDGIEYEKGAAVLRMLRAYLTAIGSSIEAIDLSSRPLRLHRRLLQQAPQQQQQPPPPQQQQQGQPEDAPLQYPTWQTEPFPCGPALVPDEACV